MLILSFSLLLMNGPEQSQSEKYNSFGHVYGDNTSRYYPTNKTLSDKTAVEHDSHWLHQTPGLLELTSTNNTDAKQSDWIVAGQYIGIVVLNLLSALFSGLVLGLLSLDVTELEILKKCGTDKERRYATTIIPMRRHSNLLLCSLVIGNVIVNAGLQVLLDRVFPGLVGFISTTICLTMFGEILPQAVCARYGLAIGAKTIWITWIVIFITFPVAFPLSKILDWSLGDEIAFVFDRERLQEYIRITRSYNNLDAQEVNIITGALKIKKCTVSQVMTKLKDVFMLSIDTMINYQTIVTIVKRGFSRIPVYSGSKRNLVGLLMVKDLALVNPNSEITLKSLLTFYRHPTMAVDEYHTLDIVLNNFREGKSHMAFVRDHKKREIIGIVTLEDIIEEVLQVEINDETDIVTDNRELKHRPNAQIPGDLDAFHVHSNEKRKLAPKPQQSPSPVSPVFVGGPRQGVNLQQTPIINVAKAEKTSSKDKKKGETSINKNKY